MHTRTGRTLLIATVSLLYVIAVHGQNPQPSHPTSGASEPQALAVPRLVKYSGALADPAGQPLAGVAGVSFALYKEHQGGSPLWIETQNVQLDERGNYSVMLGSMTREGLPLELFSSGESRWLGVQAQTPGAEEQARVLLVSVPYALKAADAEMLGGKPLSSFVLASDDVTARVQAAGGLVRTSGNSVLPTAAVTGGTSGTLSKFDVDGTTLINSVVKESGGNIGVGTGGSPGFALHVAGNRTDFISKLDNQSFASSAQGLWVNVNSGDPASLPLKITTSGGGLTPFVITGNGNVGIGTASPTDKLDVESNAETNLLFKTTAVAASTRIKLQPTSNGLAAFEGLTGTMLFGSANDLVLATGAGPVDGYTERMRVLATGNVGIGTTAPAATLDVNGTVKAAGFWGDGTALTNLQATSLTGGIVVQSNSTSPNIIGGYSGNSVAAGAVGATIGGGGATSFTNRVTDDFGTVGGGINNQAGDNAGTTSDQTYATVGGGGNNTASGQAATVGGGLSNTASGGSTTVSGGQSNTASGSYSTVGGGGVNIASQSNATVGGGGNNTASGPYATVGGGGTNTANNLYATVPGGSSNTAAGFYSLAAGRRAKANHLGAFVWGDSTDADFASTANNQFLIRASGGVGIGTSSPVSSLHVRKDAAGALGAVATIMNGLGGLGAGAALDLDTYDPGANPPSARLETLDDGSFGSHFVFLSKTPGAVTNSLAERLRITDTGSVGIGTSTPNHKFEISGGDNDLVYLSSANAGLELRSSGANNAVYIDLTDGSTNTAGSGTPDFDYRILYTGETTNQLQIASDTTNPIMTFTNGGKVGIGTTTPAAKLHLSGSEATAHGGAAALSISNTASGGGNWVLRSGATGTVTPAGGFSIADDVGYRLAIDSAGNVGIGTTTPEEKLTVFGNVRIKCCSGLLLEGGNILNNGIITTQGVNSSGDVCAANILCISSRRFKTDIETLQGSLAKVQRLRGVNFNWKETGMHDIGMIAEEVAEIVPEVVRYEQDGVTAKGMDYARLTAVLIEAVKEQQAQIGQLQSEVAGLKARLDGEVSMARK